MLLEQPLDDLDRAVDAGAERARRGEQDAAAVHASQRLLERVQRRDGVAHRADARRRGAWRSSAARPATSVRPSGWTVESTPSIALDGDVARSRGARRRAGRSPRAPPLSMSTASAPLASCSRRRSAASATSSSDASIVAAARARARRADRPPTASRRPASTTRVASTTSPTREPVVQRAGEPERDEPSVRHSVHARARRRARRTQRPRRRATRSSAVVAQASQVAQPVSVHAMLRTVSFRLFDDSNAADGSKPEWMPQCSQRGSLPGPYASHSMPSSSASYVGKMPSVSR